MFDKNMKGDNKLLITEGPSELLFALLTFLLIIVLYALYCLAVFFHIIQTAHWLPVVSIVTAQHCKKLAKSSPGILLGLGYG